MVQVPNGAGPSRSASGVHGSSATIQPVRSKPNGNSSAGPNIPLSARRAERLDMNSVERRNKPLPGWREPISRNHVSGIPEAPTFRPTEEEWREPMEYMRKIAPEGMKYGIIKLIPPDSWNPDFVVDTERFHFKTRKQELNSVEGGTRANLNYLDQLSKFHRQHGTNLNRFPSVDKRPLDLYELKKAVESRGGFERVCKGKKWAEIGRDLGYSGKIMSSLSTSLKNSYAKWLEPYELWLRGAKPGVQMQLEQERGGPFGTPSPIPSPMRKSNQHTPSSLSRDSPAIKASIALHGSINGQDTTPAPVSQPPPPPPQRPSGFTAVNSGGFTPFNAASASFIAVNNSTIPTQNFERKPDLATLNAASTMNSFATGASPNGPGSSDLKRRASDVTDDDVDKDADNAGRRSKRLRKEGAPTVTGSQCALPTRFQTLRSFFSRDRANEKPGEFCEHCGKSDDDKNMLLCDGCYNGYHTYCLDPPLTTVPDNDWHCSKCLVGTGEFGFEEGGIYSLRQFQEKAYYFKENHFAGKAPFDPILNGPRPVTEDDVEKEFWRLVSSITETVEVEYGADIHSTTHGSGFPTLEKNPRNPYSLDLWNLNVLPLNKDSLFRYIKTDISGMTVPWLYVGMCFSTFCWHNEDHYTYSANYQHFGATKTWYGIPGEDAARFEDAMREAVPELFESQPDLLFQLVTLLPPEQLRKAGVKVYAVDQRAGQFVITYPQAYHAGFNHGFNFNEAVNFAPADWEPFGQAGVERLREFRKQPCFSHDELLLTAASAKDISIKTAKWLAPALQKMFAREKAVRDAFEERVVERSYIDRIPDPEAPTNEVAKIHFERQTDSQDVSEDDYVCSYCKTYSYLSRFVCENSKKVACLDHVDSIACCSSEDGHIVHVRMTTNKLEQTSIKILDKARMPEAWTEKFHSAIGDTDKPQLKVLKSLLSEGERIPWDLPQLPGLKSFVDKCSDWVEDAQSYITRKQQNRRKSEKTSRKGSQAKLAEMEERDRELRKLSNIRKLLAEADNIGFECPEISVLQERLDAITKFQHDAGKTLGNLAFQKTQDIEDLIEVGRSYNVEIAEIDHLDKVLRQMKWTDKARDRNQGKTLQDVDDLIQQASQLNVPEHNEHLLYLRDQKLRGETWEAKAKELMAVENVHLTQLDSFSKQAADLPVSKETLAAIDAILKKQREAQDQIISLYDRSQDPEIRRRPQYKEVRDVMESLNELNSKPNGTIDLEKEQRRHEDWMRRGKRLFGKSNAPLHILLQHMETVEARNKACFDLSDKPREPVEPASRGPTPEEGHHGTSGSSRDVFCLCRTPESGLMIECTICHEWYHSKCLKIARGKVKEDDDFVCPVCDYRVKIPRDANRPKLEDLTGWQAEIPGLPFQPDEEQCLTNIINAAQSFRDYLTSFCNTTSGMISTIEELPTQRFYLRKLEGADVLLAYESNFFRQELYRLVPIAPNPPPILENSFSTRKPRPTKQQKLMAQLGVDTPEDLPQHLRTKPYNVKKRQAQDEQKAQRTPSSAGLTGSTPSKRGGYRSHTPTTLNFRPPLTAGAFPTKSHQHNSTSQPTGALISSTPGNPYTPSATATSLPAFGSPLGFGSNSTTSPPANLDPSLFTSGVGLGAFVDEVHERESSYHDHEVRPISSHDQQGDIFSNSISSQQSQFDHIFADLTNQDDRSDGSVADTGNVDPALLEFEQ